MNSSIKTITPLLIVAFLAVTGGRDAYALPIDCTDNEGTINYMEIDNSKVGGCLLSGVGNLHGDGPGDPFLSSVAGTGYEFAGKLDADPSLDPAPNPYNITFDFSNNGGTTTGVWSFDAAFWDAFSGGAIGFKFGTGNQPDQWFVFSLVDEVTTGRFTFFNLGGKGGGLSHVNLYGTEPKEVPEPMTLLLLGGGLIGMGLRRRRKV